MPALISWHLKSSSILLQASRTRARLRANLHSNLLAVYSQQKFLPLRGADQMAPCGAGNFFGGEARAGKVAGKVCARRIDAARRAGLENQGAVRQRCRQHKRKTGKEEGPHASRHANDCLALECECLTLLLGVLERICEGVWVSRFEGFWLWVSWKFILKIVCFDCRNSPFSLRGALPRTPLGASPQTPELAGP